MLGTHILNVNYCQKACTLNDFQAVKKLKCILVN